MTTVRCISWYRPECADHSSRHTDLVSILVVALLVAFLGPTASRSAAQQKTTTQDTAREIRQGSYVEKVEPGVDYKDRLPRIAPLSPAQSLNRFHTIPGFDVELAASEPLVRDPVDITFDEDGRKRYS